MIQTPDICKVIPRRNKSSIIDLVIQGLLINSYFVDTYEKGKTGCKLLKFENLINRRNIVDTIALVGQRLSSNLAYWHLRQGKIYDMQLKEWKNRISFQMICRLSI